MLTHGHAPRLVHRRGNLALVADGEIAAQAENAGKLTPDSSGNRSFRVFRKCIYSALCRGTSDPRDWTRGDGKAPLGSTGELSGRCAVA